VDLAHKIERNKSLKEVCPMPRCLKCGNQSAFASSSVYAPHYSNGLVDLFNSDGTLHDFENRGAPYETVQQAWQKPEAYFDLCANCGSNLLLWP